MTSESEFYLKDTVELGKRSFVNLNTRKTQFSLLKRSVNSRAIDVRLNGGSSLFKMLGLFFTPK